MPSFCKDCGKPFYWAQMQDGQKVPIDEKSDQVRFVVVKRREGKNPAIVRKVRTYTCHWQTCTKSEKTNDQNKQ